MMMNRTVDGHRPLALCDKFGGSADRSSPPTGALFAGPQTPLGRAVASPSSRRRGDAPSPPVRVTIPCRLDAARAAWDFPNIGPAPPTCRPVSGPPPGLEDRLLHAAFLAARWAVQSPAGTADPPMTSPIKASQGTRFKPKDLSTPNAPAGARSH